jgi:hypothetical protein
MSVLETPRIMFRGRITWDPIVTNNTPNFYDENTSTTVFQGKESVAAFRASAIAAVPTGVWNVDGTHRSVFYETQVVSVDLGKGPVFDPKADPFIQAPISFSGMLVDLEPYGATSSQLFFDTMSFGIDGGCRVFAPRHTRMSDRYINFNRNSGYGGTQGAPAGGASVVWQTSFPKTAGLRVDERDSHALQALARALQHDDVLGLTVRWNSYRTIYYDDVNIDGEGVFAKHAAELQKKLEGGGFQPNPARSELVGVLGLWRKGEPGDVPGDRSLATRDEGTIGSAWARVSTHQVTIDLSNAVPETGTDLHKTDLGELTVVAVGPDGKTVEAKLGSFKYPAYDREAYDRTAGIVTLPLDPGVAGKAAHHDLQLRKADDTVLLQETALRACPEEPNIYIDEGDKASIRVLALDRGAVPAQHLVVTLADTTATTPMTRTALTDEHGVATFPIEGKSGRVDAYALVVTKQGETATVPTQIDPQLTDYVSVRCLPADGKIARLPPTWENVHRYVLANWEAMAPCMDNWLRLGDPVQVKELGGMLRRLTAKSNFEGFRFMPVTRDLTQGQRTLLYAWLDGKPAAASTEAVGSPAAPSQAERSRALRSR